MIDKIIELFDKGYCNECNELNCLGGEPSSKTVANAIRELQQENQQLKEQNEKLRTIRVDYEYLTENTILIDNYTKTRISKNKYLIECEDGNFVDINELEQKLKQRDKVIDELEKFITKKEYQPSPLGWELELNPKELIELKSILQKYKGDNK